MAHQQVGDHHALVAAWMGRLPLDGDGRRPPIQDQAADLARLTVAAPDDLPVAVARFARRSAADGWTLDQVLAWTRAFAEVLDEHGVGAHGAYLRSFEAGVALGQGWATGSVHRNRVDGCTDMATGLPTGAVLRWRMRQVYDQCESLGLAPEMALAVVVVDLESRSGRPLVAGLARALVASQIRGAFDPADTVAAVDHRVLVLTHHDDDLGDRVATLTAELRCDVALSGVDAHVWVERVPARPEAIDRFVADLSA